MASTTRFIGTCPVCENRIKVRGGTLVHHGYERPGDGHIVGDCFAVNRTPHETSPETAKAYREVLVSKLEGLEKSKAHFETTSELLHSYHRVVGSGRLAQRKSVWVTVQKGDEATRIQDPQDNSWHHIPSFALVKAQRLDDNARDTKRVQADIERMTKLVDTWTRQDLTTVEEETAKSRAEAQAKRDEKQKARDTKSAEKAERDAARAAKAQAKIDAAVAKCVKILDAVDPTNVAEVRKAYLHVLQLKLDVPAAERWSFYEAHLGARKDVLKAAGLVYAHNGHLFNFPEDIYRMSRDKA